MQDTKEQLKNHIRRSMFAVLALVLGIFFLTSAHVFAEKAAEGVQAVTSLPTSIGFIAAAVAVGLGSVGAGIAVGYVASAALGVISEKPELFGMSLIFVGLAEGIAIYGLIIAIMILTRI